jgi:polar amino acid transport system substrate-binding protein
MKKFTALLLAAVLLVAALSACSAKTQTASSAASTASASSAPAASASASAASASASASAAASSAASASAASSADSDYAKVKAKGTVVVGITDFAPMDYKDDSGNWTGFDAELATQVFEKMGLKVEFLEIDWDNKILELNAGDIDCVWNGMTLTDEVLNSMSCTDPYVLNAQVVVMDSSKIKDGMTADDVKDLNFAVEAGSAGDGAASDAGFNVTQVSSQANALMEVAAGTSDATVIDLTMAKAMTGAGTSYPNLAVALELTNEEYGIGFRQGSDMTAMVNDILGQLRDDGSLQKLADKYGLSLAEKK